MAVAFCGNEPRWHIPRQQAEWPILLRYVVRSEGSVRSVQAQGAIEGYVLYVNGILAIGGRRLEKSLFGFFLISIGFWNRSKA